GKIKNASPRARNTDPITIAPTEDHRAARRKMNTASNPRPNSMYDAIVMGWLWELAHSIRAPPSVNRYHATGAKTRVMSTVHQCAAAREREASSNPSKSSYSCGA